MGVEMENIDTRNPSEVVEEYWINSYSPSGRRPVFGKTGKWLLFIPLKDIDEEWSKIRSATVNGKLGPASKASTAMPNPNARNPDTKVICVYTCDHENEDDVMRVREELRRLGYTKKIAYKTDEATLQGRYQIKGDTRISKYYC